MAVRRLKATFTGIYSLAFNYPPTKLYLADLENRRVRVIEMKTGTVDLFAGNGKLRRAARRCRSQDRAAGRSGAP